MICARVMRMELSRSENGKPKLIPEIGLFRRCKNGVHHLPRMATTGEHPPRHARPLSPGSRTHSTMMNPRDRAGTAPAPPPTAEVSLLAGRSRFLGQVHGGHETKETALIHVADGGEALPDGVVVGGFGDGEATPPPVLAPSPRRSVASMLRASQLLVTKPAASVRSFATSLRIGGKHASAVAAEAEMVLAGGGGLRDPGAASASGASGPPRACCFRATTVSDLWPVGLFTLVLMCGASFAVGAALDLDFFDELVFYSALFPLLILIPWALMMLRFALLVGTHGTAAEDVLDLAVFVVFFLLVHYVAMGVFGIEWGFASSQGFRYENSANQMSSQLRDMVAMEEFPAEFSPNMYKSLMDVASVEEVYQWMQGPFLANMLECSSDTVKYPHPTSACRLNDGKYVRSYSVEMRTLRVKPAHCSDPRLDLENGDPGCWPKFNEENIDKGTWHELGTCRNTSWAKCPNVLLQECLVRGVTDMTCFNNKLTCTKEGKREWKHMPFMINTCNLASALCAPCFPEPCPAPAELVGPQVVQSSHGECTDDLKDKCGALDRCFYKSECNTRGGITIGNYLQVPKCLLANFTEMCSPCYTCDASAKPVKSNTEAATPPTCDSALNASCQAAAPCFDDTTSPCDAKGNRQLTGQCAQASACAPCFPACPSPADSKSNRQLSGQCDATMKKSCQAAAPCFDDTTSPCDAKGNRQLTGQCAQASACAPCFTPCPKSATNTTAAGGAAAGAGSGAGATAGAGAGAGTVVNGSSTGQFTRDAAVCPDDLWSKCFPAAQPCLDGTWGGVCNKAGTRMLPDACKEALPCAACFAPCDGKDPAAPLAAIGESKSIPTGLSVETCTPEFEQACAQAKNCFVERKCDDNTGMYTVGLSEACKDASKCEVCFPCRKKDKNTKMECRIRRPQFPRSAHKIYESVEFDATQQSKQPCKPSENLPYWSGEYLNFKGKPILGPSTQGAYGTYPPGGHMLSLSDGYHPFFDPSVAQPAVRQTFGLSSEKSYVVERKR